jgi:hypothetical protein
MTEQEKLRGAMVALGRACGCHKPECECCAVYQDHLHHRSHLNITEFFENAEPSDYSGSMAELGEFAGKLTYDAAVSAHDMYQLLLDEEHRALFKHHINGYGAWSDDEVAKWSHAELNALAIQFVAGDIREAGLYPGMTDDEWEEYESRAQEGRVPGNIWRDGIGNYFYSMEG